MKAEYLIFNLLIISSLFLANFFYKKMLFPQTKTAFNAIAPVALFFIIWDILVTNHWWFFNPKHNLGIYLFNLPIEEIMFFFTVPFACITLWVNLKNINKNKKFKFLENDFIKNKDTKIFYIAITIMFLLFIVNALHFGDLNSNKEYTLTVLSLFFITFLNDYFSNLFLFKKIKFLIFILIVIILTTIFNGYLTMRPVVIYNTQVKTDLLVYTIPIEDYFYGLILIINIIYIYEKLNKKV